MRSDRFSLKAFTMVEVMVSLVMTAFVLLIVTGLFIAFQKHSSQTGRVADAQQNARIALDYVTDHLRQAGTGTDYVRGQGFIVHGSPYQVVMNADIDNGQTIAGNPPLSSINKAFSPNTVPPSGTILYSPPRDFMSDAETIVLTLDSNGDGTISAGDRGDDPEEDGKNPNLYVLKRIVYGFDGAGANTLRESKLALLRGPAPYRDGSRPQPLFQYYYDDDDDVSTPDKLWGDNNPENGVLGDNEIAALTPVPQSLLNSIRKVRVTATSESNKVDPKYADNGGFLSVTMNSEVHVRNASRSSSIIYGQVYHDADNDGEIDEGETGIPDVEIRVAGLGRSTRTNSYGYYYVPLSAGKYSIQEIDPFGYTSTTPNLVSVALGSGQTAIVNFGDIASGPIGYIQGTVFDDGDQNGVKGSAEAGIPGILISLDSGEQATTNEKGDYSFVVMVGNYNVVETDPEGYGSTTPNSVGVDLLAAGDTITVNFGDVKNPTFGTLEGYVYLDNDADGARDRGEPGIANVTLKITGGDTTLTNTAGYYRFSIPPGVYSIFERDPEGYTSTTVNSYHAIIISPDTTVTRHFGDILDTQTDFVEIEIGNTERALSVRAFDFKEDNKNDPDVILGSPHTGGLGNLLVYFNKWKNNTTPITQLFDNAPDYRRSAAHNVNTMAVHDFSGDGKNDLLTGLERSTGNNIQIWFNGNQGVLSNAPDATYRSDGTTLILESRLGDFDRDGVKDIVVGLKTSFGTFTGAFQTFKGNGNASYAPWRYVSTAGPNGQINLGEISGLDIGDVDGDGDLDIVVGSRTNTYSGIVDVYENEGNGSGNFRWASRYLCAGAVNELRLVDMMEDDRRDPDIIAAVATGSNAGAVYLWLNTAGVFGVKDTMGFQFKSEETPNWPDDYFNAAGEALSIGITFANRDIFPDILVGTRKSSFYTGDLFLLKTFGALPSSGLVLNSSSSGEIITIDTADFNKDNKRDVVVGTRTSASQGKLIIYFNNEQ